MVRACLFGHDQIDLAYACINPDDDFAIALAVDSIEVAASAVIQAAGVNVDDATIHIHTHTHLAGQPNGDISHARPNLGAQSMRPVTAQINCDCPHPGIHRKLSQCART